MVAHVGTLELQIDACLTMVCSGTSPPGVRDLLLAHAVRLTVISYFFQVAYTMVGMISGAIYFGEFDGLTPLAQSMFVLGMLGMALGIALSVSPAALAAGVETIQANIEGERLASGVPPHGFDSWCITVMHERATPDCAIGGFGRHQYELCSSNFSSIQ